MKKILFIVFTMLCLCSCEQSMIRSFGGTMKIELEPGEKLIEATWKGDDIWYLVEPMDSGYTPKTKVFQEASRFGVLEGEVTFIENR